MVSSASSQSAQDPSRFSGPPVQSTSKIENTEAANVQSAASKIIRYAPTGMPSLGGVTASKKPQAVTAPIDGVYRMVKDSQTIGKVIEVITGQYVERGQLLGLVEMLKNQYMVLAPCSGFIQAIHVQPGQKVMPGEPLMLIQPSRANRE